MHIMQWSVVASACTMVHDSYSMNVNAADRTGCIKHKAKNERRSEDHVVVLSSLLLTKVTERFL